MKNYNGNIGIGDIAPKRLISIRIKRSEYKEKYSLRARIGVQIARLLGIVQLILTD